jgi:transcriptional regulator with XRE-family HTH domain
MATSDTDRTSSESAYIGAQLQELAAQMGISQAELSRRVGIDRRTLNPYWTGARPAGLPTIRKIAQATGRSVAWLMGEGMGRPVVGIADPRGRVTMQSPLTTPSIVRFPQSVGPFAAGTDVLVDPCRDAYEAGVYMLVRTRETGDSFFAWGRVEGTVNLLDRLDGELHVYVAARYEVVGVIVGMVVPPPRPLSA